MARNRFEGLGKKGTTIEGRSGVVDAAGVTYHRLIKDQDIEHEFPDYFQEKLQRSAIFNEWDETISLLLENLDTMTVDRLYRLTKDGDKYDAGKPFDYTTKFSPEEIEQYKRKGLKHTLILGSEGNEDIAQTLIAGNPKAEKLHTTFVTNVRGAAERNQEILNQTRSNWIKTSMSISPEQLPASKAYAELREAFARNGAYIRFVPHQKIPDEPPCAGTDYKPSHR